MSHLQRVTKEQAVKLKELGFDWKCHSYYHKNQNDITPYLPSDTGNAVHYHIYADRFSAPETALVIKWLREVKGIKVLPCHQNMSGKYGVEIYIWSEPNNTGTWERRSNIISYNTQEQAESAGLDVALDYLMEKMKYK